jgi:hypothetical protein
MPNQLPRYRCHKEVEAVKIAAIDREKLPKWKGATCKGCFAFGSACGHCERCDWERVHGPYMGVNIVPAEPGMKPIPVTAAYLAKHEPQVGGYLVIYDDGYYSYSPAAAFEAGYTLIS